MALGWLTGWDYRKSHTITGSSGGAQTDYQRGIKVYYGAGVDGTEVVDGITFGKVYCNSKCKTDFGDIRFTGSDEESHLVYGIRDQVNGSYAIIYVEVDAIPISPNTVDIFVYYGNATATTTGIELRENFNSYTEYDVTEDIDVITDHHVDFQCDRNGVQAWLYYDKGAGYYTDFACNIDIKVISSDGSMTLYFPWVLANAIDTIDDLRSASEDFIYAYWTEYPAETRELRIREETGGSQYTDIYATGVPPQWFYFIIKKYGTSFKAEIYSDAARTTLVDTLELTLHGDWNFRYVYAADTFVDNDAVVGVGENHDYHFRKYVDPEPTHTAWGDEETSGATYEKTYLVDALFQRLGIAESFGIDAQFGAAVYEISRQIDAMFTRLGIVNPFDIDATLQRLNITESAGVDTFLLLPPVVSTQNASGIGKGTPP